MDENWPPNTNTSAIDAVSRYRVALLGNASGVDLQQLATQIDPDLVTILRLMDAARQEQVQLDPASADRIQQRLLATAHLSRMHWATPPVKPSSPIPPRPVVTPPAGRRMVSGAWLRSAAGHLATAALVIALLLVGVAMSGVGRFPLQTWLTDPLLHLPSPAISLGQLEFLWESTGGPEGFRRAYGMAIDPEGQLWVADAGAQQITILSPDGTVRESWGEAGAGPGQFNFIGTYVSDGSPRADIAFDAHGNIYVTDPGNHRVQKFDPDRRFLQSWGREGTNDGEFLVPTSIAIDAAGTVYVSDALRNDIQRFDADGAFLGLFSDDGEVTQQLQRPTGITIDRNGDVWVVNFGSDRIQHFSPAGELLASWGVSGINTGELDDPVDVAVDRAGRVYVVDQKSRRVQAFAADGQFLAAVGGFGGGPGFFNKPAGLALGEDGTVYVSDRYSVQAFRAVFPPWAQLLS